MRYIALILVLILFAPALADAAATTGTLTRTVTEPAGWQVIELDWTPDGAGTCYDQETYAVGLLMRVTFVPDSGTPPTALYDVTLSDADGFDVLAGLGADLSDDTTTSVVPLIGDGTTNETPVVVVGRLDLLVEHAGAGGGTIRLYLRK